MTAAAMLTAVMPFSMMVFPMMRALYIGIISQISFCQCLGSFISTAGHAAIELDSRSSQRHLCAAANTSADQRIHVQCSKHAGQGTMTAAVGIYNFRRDNLSILNIIDLKLSGMAKMLKNFSVFIGNCNSHNGFSFRFFKQMVVSVFVAVALTAVRYASITQTVLAAPNHQWPSLYQGIRQLLPSLGINQLHRGTGDPHPFGALFLG